MFFVFQINLSSESNLGVGCFGAPSVPDLDPFYRFVFIVIVIPYELDEGQLLGCFAFGVKTKKTRDKFFSFVMFSSVE